jgi:polyribonucleotide nucleotidyltransferase
MIRSIIERTGVKIDVEDNGTVNVASPTKRRPPRRSASSRNSPRRPS